MQSVETLVRRTPVAVPAEVLFAWHERPGALGRLTPPWQDVRLERFDGIRDGDEALIRLGAGPIGVRWLARHQGYQAGRQFEDVQIRGLFASWTHTHRALPDGPGRSILEDEVRYRLPLPPVSGRLAGRLVRAQLDRTFAYRHRVTRADVERHAAGPPPMTVAVTGASGLLGEALVAFLLTGGHRVVRLVRSRRTADAPPRRPGEQAVYWNPDTGELDLDRLARARPDAAIHLAGESVYGVWTAAKRRRIWESRTRGTLLLSRALARLPHPPHTMISASGTGYYGDRGHDPLPESAGPGEGFLADLCQAWEAAADPARDAGIRTVQARLGVVLSPKGGALGLLHPLALAGLAGWPGRGDGWLSWVALDDVLYALLYLLAADEARGPVNLVAPAPATLKGFIQTLGAVLGRPTPARVPEGLVAALGGRAAREVALASARVVPERLSSGGFTFAYPDLDRALRHVLGRTDAVPA